MRSEQSTKIKVLVWGTFDEGKPRTRLTLKALEDAQCSVSRIHKPIWSRVEDKSTLGVFRFFGFALKALLAYPILILRFFFHSKPDAVLIAYPGHVDVLVLWVFAKIRRTPIVWDVFMSAYDTIVDDRQLISSNSVAAKILRCCEKTSCRAAKSLVLDTEAQADYFRRQYNLPHEHVYSVPVGTETALFDAAPKDRAGAKKSVLFYGQFIPLHGIKTIVRAAKLTEEQPFVWTIIGTGQTRDSVQQLIENLEPKNLVWIDWVPYEDLIEYISRADVCLGIFGNSAKAGRVIPNKVYQILTAGRPLVTRDSPAIRELIPSEAEGVELIEAENSYQLADAVTRMLANSCIDAKLHDSLKQKFSPTFIATRWSTIIRSVLQR